MPRRHKQGPDNPTRKPWLPFLIVVLLAVILGYRYASSALSVLKKDRINVVVYGQNSLVYSLGLHEAGNYAVPFYPDLKIDVPGGYGFYRVGAVGKLAALEHKPDIYKKAYSRAVSAYIDFYFYKPSQQVYFGGPQEGNKLPDIRYPGIADIMFDRSNATLGEKLAVAYAFLKTPPQQFDVLPDIGRHQGAEQYQGYFYQETYRNEKKDVQILYSKDYESADRIALILQGNGIRVADISQSAAPLSRCRVKEQSQPYSATAASMARFFGCELAQGKTDIYDILFELGEREKEW